MFLLSVRTPSGSLPLPAPRCTWSRGVAFLAPLAAVPASSGEPRERCGGVDLPATSYIRIELPLLSSFGRSGSVCPMMPSALARSLNLIGSPTAGNRIRESSVTPLVCVPPNSIRLGIDFGGAAPEVAAPRLAHRSRTQGKPISVARARDIDATCNPHASNTSRVPGTRERTGLGEWQPAYSECGAILSLAPNPRHSQRLRSRAPSSLSNPQKQHYIHYNENVTSMSLLPA